MIKDEGRSAYKDLLVWQKSMEYANQVIELIDQLETPRKHYRLFEQLEASVTSVPMNIAEGKGRESKKEFMHFLYIARGYLFEVLTLLEIFQMRGWLSKAQFDAFETNSNEIAKMLNGLIKSIAQSL
jgi:four helix bundle protein